MSATTFEPSTSSIDSDEPRILFWPSDSNGAPHIPISSISPETKAYAGGDDVAGETQNFVIIGWAEQPLQEVSPNTSINSIHTSSKNVIAIGAIELSIHGGKVANRDDTTNFATMENPQAKELVQKISASIENLAKTNPCLYPLPESDASSSTSNCGKCKTCATFQSLRVLSIVSKVNSMEKENNHDKQSSSKNQIVLYNPQKADDWGYQQCDIYFHSMEYESWEMCLLRISEASKVFKHLIHTMNILSTTSATGDSETKQKVGSRVSGYHRERKKCDTWQKHPDHELSSPTLGDKSMLWTHLATQKANCDQQSILKGCNTTEHSWYEASFGFLIKIPLALIITVIYRRRAATGIKECNIPSKSFIAAILIDSILGLAIGTILMQYPIPIIHYVSSLWKNVHNRLWNDGLHWLESFPAGFKLNVALTHQMGKAVRLGLLYQQSILCYIFQADSILIATETTPNPSVAITVIQYIGLFTAIMGSRFFFAFAFDMTRLGTLHIHYLSSLFSTCQRCELSTLTSLWLLFRGKKRNILRHRSDHLQYDHMQLLLGMIFFTVCLFLFTTILVYHCFFAAMDFLAEMMTCTWWCLFMIVEGGMHLERILMEEKAAMDRGDGWIGRGVRLLNKGPLAGDSLGAIENAFFGHFFGDTDSDRIFADGNPAIIKANSTFQWKMNEDSSSSMEMKNIPHVSLHSSSTSIQEISFPTSSNFKILTKAFGSFAISKIKKITCLIEKFLFGKSCRIASCCVELLRRLYCRGSFVERISMTTISKSKR